MLDRASTFAEPGIVRMLRRDFVPVALDQAYERRRQDAVGAFYREVASQGPRHDFASTTQGFYVATAAGELLLYNNNRDPAKLRRLLGEALQRFSASDAARADVTPAAAVPRDELDARWSARPPAGGLVVRVRARVLGGYPAPESDKQRILQHALSRDNLWLTAAEHDALVRGALPRSLLLRIARFHLVDNTRGEPPMWRADEVAALQAELAGGRISGRVRLATQDGARGYDAALLGFVRTDGDRVTAFDLVADGRFHGEGRYTRGAPPGRFPFAVAFELATGDDPADAIPPQGSRGWVDGYLRPR